MDRLDPAHARRLFDQAAELPAGDREGFLLRECTDPTLRAFVLRLVEAHERDTSFLLRRGIGESAAGAVLATGKRIGPYVIEAEIGRGGMGAVYRAVRCDDTYRKTVAVKVVSAGIPENLFRRERQIMASLEHANIARLLDGGATDDGSLYLVMEFVDGERIDVWANQRDLSTRRRIELLLAVSDAIAYAHRNLVVHRDLKPANILVTRDGVPKLLDFGVAKVVASESGDTRTVMAALTPEYASPEQIRGENVTTATDVYSLGLVLFELLTRGAHPYRTTKGTLPARLRAVLEEEPRRPSAYVEGRLQAELRGELDKIALKAIAKEPERRYASVHQLRADLEAYLAGKPVLAQGNDFLYRARKFVRRHWLPVAAAAAVLASGVAGTLAVLRQAHIAEQRRLVAEQATLRAQDLLGKQRELLDEQVALRGRAESEAHRAREQHLIAQKRLGHARDLAAALLFDIHDAVRDLQGASVARRRIIASAVGQLEALSRDAPEDSNVQGILAAAYERAGDLVGGIQGEGTDGTSAGLDYYQKSLDIQQRLAQNAATARAPETWRRLANVHRRIGNVHYRNQNVKAAARSLDQALESLEAGRKRGGRWPELEADIYHYLCIYQAYAGEHAASAATCRAAIAKARQFVSGEFTAADARHNRAVHFQRLAVMSRQAGNVSGALEFLNAGIQQAALLVREHPDNAAYRRTLSMMLGFLAQWREQIGGQNAADGYRAALESFRAARAADSRQTIVNMLHAWTAMRYSVVLHGSGRVREAREAVRESTGIFEELIRAPKAGFMEFNDYACELLRCTFRDLCDVNKALMHAETAVGITKRQNAFALDTLANAYFRNGMISKAVETEKSALSLAANLPQAARDEIEKALRRFEAEAARHPHEQ
jgi:tRNA A-37 threonylcarbamoyl transferase component Bud32/tetratricopeptide (TPR) repeat protein